MSANEIIDRIIALDADIADLRDGFEKLDVVERENALVSAMGGELKSTTDSDPLPLSLVRITDLVCGLEGGAAPMLAVGLCHDNADVRELFGEALLSVADDNIEVLIPAVDKVLAEGGRGAQEMPFLLTLVDDPTVARIIERFLGNKDSDVALAAIEALAEVCDPSSIPALKSASDDNRTVTLDGMDGESSDEWTLGKLAGEAIEMIEMDTEEEE